MKTFGVVLAIILAVTVTILGFNYLSYIKTDDEFSRPWEVLVTKDGATEIFGLKPGKTNVLDSSKLLVAPVKFALIKNKNKIEKARLEAYYEKVNLSGIMARLVLVFSSTEDTIDVNIWTRFKKQNLNQDEEFIHLEPSDLQEFKSLKLESITLIPRINLTEDKIHNTFGVAPETIKLNAETTHFLYPEIGADVALNHKAKDVIQYVSPKEFHLIREPLLKHKP